MQGSHCTLPQAVLSAWGLRDAPIAPVDGGLINQTFVVGRGASRTIVQRVNPIFAPSVHLDIEAITAHLAGKGVSTPRLVPTQAGDLWHAHGDAVWRALTFIDGCSIAQLPHRQAAAAAGEAVARFHLALDDLSHRFHFTRPAAHDTPGHLARLQTALAAPREHPLYDAVAPVGAAILAHGETLPATGELPQRIIHGDLKCQNLRFSEDLDHVVALLDLDTMAHDTLEVELGDALRSWCNPLPEDAAGGHVDLDLFAGAVGGYLSAARPFIAQGERDALIPGLQRIALELSARFCADALNEDYFGWDAARYPRAGAHHLARARGQLAVAESVQAQRGALEAAVARVTR